MSTTKRPRHRKSAPKPQDTALKTALSLLPRRRGGRGTPIFRNARDEAPVALPRVFLIRVADQLEDCCELLESLPRFRRAVAGLFDVPPDEPSIARQALADAPEFAAALDTLAITIAQCLENLDAAIRIVAK